MHAQSAYIPLLALVRSGQLGLHAIKPKVFSLPDLEHAMERAMKAESLELVVLTSTNGES
jgi:hypothetical protein